MKSSPEERKKVALATLRLQKEDPEMPREYMKAVVKTALEEGRIKRDGTFYPKV